MGDGIRSMGCFSNVQAPIRITVSRDVADKDILEKYGVSQDAPKPEAKKGSGPGSYSLEQYSCWKLQLTVEKCGNSSLSRYFKNHRYATST